MSINEAALRAQVAKFYTARLSNVPEACLELFADNGQMEFAGESRLSGFPPLTVGKEKQLTVLRDLIGVWQWRAVDHQRIFVDGNGAMIRFTLTTQHTPSGRLVTTDVVDHIELDANLNIVRLVEYIDTALAHSLSLA